MTHRFFERDHAAVIGANIRHLREGAGLAVQHLAARCGIEPERLIEAEAGAGLLPAIDLLTVARRLGCGFDALFDEPPPPKVPS